MDPLPQRLPPDLDLYVLAGPTAVGKTELALRWAERERAEIVSADSLLFYRGMDIGTAKPTVAERARVPHHLIDVAEPDQPWDVQQYLTAAAEVVAGIHRRGRRVLVTGGSGFYLKSFLAPVIDAIEVPPEISRRVAAIAERGREALAAELRRVDPEADLLVDMNNPRRVLKALERCLTTGRSVGELREEMRGGSFPFERCRKQVTLVVRDRELLLERIVRRVDAMLAGGLIDEVRALLERGLKKNHSAAAAIGYRETIRHLAGELSREELREEIIRNTRRLVKKQLTWYRHQLPEPFRTVTLSEEADPDADRLFAVRR